MPTSTMRSLSIDHHVGARLRARRGLRQVRQATLAKLIGVSLAELQAIEEGRVEAGPKALLLAADVLNVHPRYFFLGFNTEGAAA